MHAANDDGAIGITVEEVDEHFVTDARQRHQAIAVTGPSLTDAEPTTRFGTTVAVSVPMKTNFHPAVAVRMHVASTWADNDGALHSVDPGLRRLLWRNVRIGRQRAHQLALPRLSSFSLQAATDNQQSVPVAQALSRVSSHREHSSGAQTQIVGEHGQPALSGSKGSEPLFGAL